MKFIFQELTRNNEKYVARFYSEDTLHDLYITSPTSDVEQFKVGQSYTLTEN